MSKGTVFIIGTRRCGKCIFPAKLREELDKIVLDPQQWVPERLDFLCLGNNIRIILRPTLESANDEINSMDPQTTWVLQLERPPAFKGKPRYHPKLRLVKINGKVRNLDIMAKQWGQKIYDALLEKKSNQKSIKTVKK